MVDGLTPAQHATRTIRERQAAQLALAAAAEADRALARAENARGMVLHDRPTLASLDERMGAAEQRQMTPGPPGKDSTVAGPPGKDSTAAGPPGRDSTVPGAPGKDSTVPGPPGASAFEVAQAAGFTGDRAAWLASLKGADGKNSTTAGPAGKDAYEVAIAAGYTGTRAEWLASLRGPAGPSSGTWQIVEGLTVPPMLSLLGGASTVDVPVTWPAPFPDAVYVVTATVIPAAATLLGRTGATLKAGTRTATGCTVTVTTTAILAAGQATVTVRADRKA